MSYVRKLAQKSLLTAAQVESLLLRRRVLDREITSREAAALRTPRPVSLGTYHRVLGQATSNLETAIWTVVVGVSINLLRKEELGRLLDLLAKSVTPTRVMEGRENEALDLVRAIVRRIVIR